MNALSEDIQTVKPRLDSLKANRNFFTFLFTLESAALTLIVKYLLPNYNWLSITTGLLALTLICMLIGLFALTDTIHHYSKFIEFRHMWGPAFEKAYPKKTSEEKATEAMEDALEADNVAYGFQKWSMVALLWAISSLILTQNLGNFYIGFAFFLLLGAFFTFLMVWTYKRTHKRTWRDAFIKYFYPKSVY